MNPIDKILRQRLKHHHHDVPPHLWEMIESRLPQKRSVFQHTLPIVALMIISALFGLTLYEILVDTNKYNDSVNTGVKFTAISVDSEERNIAEDKFDEYPSEAAQSDFKAVPLDVNKMEIQNKEVLTNKVISDIVISQSGNKDSFKEFHTDILKTVKRMHSSETGMIVGQNTDADHSDILQNSSYSDIHHASALKESEILSIERIERSEVKSNIALTGMEGLLPGIKFNTIQQNCPSFRYTPKGIFAELFYASDFNSRSISGEDDIQKYIIQRNQSESPLYSFSAGLRLGYQLNNKISLKSGLEMRWINEKFKYIDPESNQTRLVTIKDYVYQNGRIVDSVVTQEVVIIPGAVKYTIYNTITSVDIPLLFSYNIFHARRINAALTAGPIINLRTYQKGMILSPAADGNTIKLDDNNNSGEQVYKSATGMSLTAALSLQYKLNTDFDLLLEPGIRKQMNSITLQEFPLKQNFTSFSITTGIRYNF